MTWTWRKSSHSAGGGECVEIGTSPDTSIIAIRDSKQGDASPVLRFTPAHLATFMRAAKS
jgi:hypothetical protein